MTDTAEADRRERASLYGAIDPEKVRDEQKHIYNNVNFNFYRYFSPKPNFCGEYNNTDGEGFRLTPQRGAVDGEPCRHVLFFGGSTMWGVGAQADADTIPAVFARRMEELHPETRWAVRNYGVGGYVSPQEMIVFLERLGREPIDMAIFLDGVNEAHMGWEEFMFNGMWQRFLQPSVYSGVPGCRDLMRRLFAMEFPNPKSWIAPNPDIDKLEGDLLAPELAQAERVTALYRHTKDIIDALADGFGFDAHFFLQPDLYSKPSPSPYEARSPYWKRPRFILFERAVYGLFREEFEGDPNFHDISLDIATDETVFLDDHHTNRRGNELIVDAMVRRLGLDVAVA